MAEYEFAFYNFSDATGSALGSNGFNSTSPSTSGLYNKTLTISGDPAVIKVEDDDPTFDGNPDSTGQTITSISGTATGLNVNDYLEVAYRYTVEFQGTTYTVYTLDDGNNGSLYGFILPKDLVTAMETSGNSTITFKGQHGSNPDVGYSTLYVCFEAGVFIETAAGPVAAGDIREGDLIRTKDNGFQPVRWVGKKTLTALDRTTDKRMLPIRIRRDALAPNIPSQDLLVSPQHRVLVHSAIAQRMFGAAEVLVAAKQLCLLNGIDIAYDLTEVTYVHFLFDEHQIVYSNGACTESLHTGPEGMKAVGPAARAEIFALFPELENGHMSKPARHLASGRMGRKLAVRHAQHGKALVN